MTYLDAVGHDGKLVKGRLTIEEHNIIVDHMPLNYISHFQVFEKKESKKGPR